MQSIFSPIDLKISELASLYPNVMHTFYSTAFEVY
jgi:hypothetical protein